MDEVTARQFVVALTNYKFLFNELRNGVPDVETNKYLGTRLLQARKQITTYIEGSPKAEAILTALEA